MKFSMDNPPPAAPALSNRQVETIRGQLHKFVLIPPMPHYTEWFDAGPVSIGVETRALGGPGFIVRGPSIHVFDAARSEEYLRFDVFGKVPHYHYILNDRNHNVLWGYDPDVNGPMIPWVVASLRDRLPGLLRRAGAEALAAEIDACGWNSDVLPAVARAAAAALAPHPDDEMRAKEGTDWMYRWKRVHPQFNTVEEGEY